MLCIKPNSNNSELVIRYDGFPTLYAFDYEEYSDNLVKVIDLEPQHIIGKFIRHRFIDEEESDEWFENGKIISYNPATELYTVNYFDDLNSSELTNDDNDYDETLLDVYETLTIDLVEDNDNNDILFV